MNTVSLDTVRVEDDDGVVETLKLEVVVAHNTQQLIRHVDLSALRRIAQRLDVILSKHLQNYKTAREKTACVHKILSRLIRV